MHHREDQALAKLENALADAARRFVVESRLALEKTQGCLFIEATCRRLGLSSAIASAIADGSADSATRTAAIERLRVEKATLQRLGRRAHPAYDLNRHIAVHHALKMLVENASRAAAPSRPPSGRDLNRRFARPKRATRRPTSRPSGSLKIRTAVETAAR